MAFENLLADRTGKMGVNVIREILKVVSQPSMVSLAGGIPAPESFPLEIIGELTEIVIEKYASVAFQQGIDLHTSTFNQALAAEYIAGGFLERHLPKIIDLYRPKQDAMLLALDTYFPEGFKWSRPEGGMFLWVEGPEGFDMEEMYWKAVKRNVAFVPGKYFYTSRQEGLEIMRLNYTMADAETINASIKILSDVIKS